MGEVKETAKRLHDQISDIYQCNNVGDYKKSAGVWMCLKRGDVPILLEILKKVAENE